MILLGIDVGGTRLKAGLVDGGGAVLKQDSASTPDTIKTFHERLKQLVGDVIQDARPAATGFACKGIIEPDTTLVDRLPGAWQFLEGHRLDETLAGLIPDAAPVTADNDAKAALAGEVMWGAAQGRRNVLLLTLGTGIGGAVLDDGRLLRGASGVAGHLGHTLVDPDGNSCLCGAKGCLETVFSSRAIEAEAWSAMHQGVASPMTRELRENPASLNCRRIFEHAAGGDRVAMEILGRRIELFGAGLAGLLHAFDPEIVILTGQVAEAGEQLFAPLRRAVHSRTQGLLRRDVPIVPGGVNDTSGVVGAAALAKMALQRSIQLAQ